MNTLELGRTGEQVGQLALGCMLMGTDTDEASSIEMLNRYVEAGGNFLDTANCYAWWARKGSHGGESEELLGRWFASHGRRDEVFLATKGSAVVRDPEQLWNDGAGPDWAEASTRFEGAGGDTLRRALDASLRRLGTDHVDVYYVHVDDRSTPLEETLEALSGIVAAGKARYIGWSNVRTWRLERIRQVAAQHGWVAPVAVQQQHSYLRRRAGLENASIVDDEQLDYLREHDDLTLVAYSPILKGIYDDPAKRAAHAVMQSYAGPDAEARLAVLTDVAAEVDATPNQLVLAWLMQRSSPRIATLIGPRTLPQFEAALPALDVKLTDEQVARLDAAGA
jgi:aryl-alcohol dehydrogenase-like predicted oxidoreductase